MVAVGSFALVGREEELARLQQFVHDVADGPS
jgi:hypothetical protein